MAEDMETMELTPKFDAVTIVTSETYKRYANLLDVVLEPDKTYSHAEIEEIIKKSLARPVKVVVND
nr:MAG TPA_asm: hypothetical protein [Caudoviricetes sp.]